MWGRTRLRVLEDVSLVCTDADPAFDWCRKSVAHIRWDSGPVLRRVLRWVNRVSHGKEDLRQTHTPAEFVPGGTIGRMRRDWGIGATTLMSWVWMKSLWGRASRLSKTSHPLHHRSVVPPYESFARAIAFLCL